MSIKRSRQVRNFPRRDDDAPAKTRKQAPEKSWGEHLAGQNDSTCIPFSLSAQFTEGAFILHPTFGKGVVLSASQTIIECLFEQGKKKLAHNKPS